VLQGDIDLIPPFTAFRAVSPMFAIVSLFSLTCFNDFLDFIVSSPFKKIF
jgi:hypothetical protein